MTPIVHYLFVLSLDEKANAEIVSNRRELSKLLGISLAGQRYVPHITLLDFNREENDDTVIKKALQGLEGISNITLEMKGIQLFSTNSKDTVVYTFKNPESVNRLHTQLSLAYLKRPNLRMMPHITIAKEIEKLNPEIVSQLPAFSKHLIKCASFSILKKEVNHPESSYIPVYTMTLK
jgi:2'-5' RNA ligase